MQINSIPWMQGTYFSEHIQKHIKLRSNIK